MKTALYTYTGSANPENQRKDPHEVKHIARPILDGKLIELRMHNIPIRRTQPTNRSIVIKNLERVDKNRFNDADLPPSVCDVATRIGSQESRARGMDVSFQSKAGTRCSGVVPKADGKVSGIHPVLGVMFLDLVEMLRRMLALVGAGVDGCVYQY
jgi:hypothetical protein